ncbi:MAG: membrane protein insertion efficiency factor YidD [Ignavibacteria bacterium]|nr:membrane protein insertion efficiency factor YidD [Ignavibacteria bacterium]
MIKSILIFLLIFGFSVSLYSQHEKKRDLEPWESEDIINKDKSDDFFPYSYYRVLSLPMTKLINIYQSDISPNSIHRCMFHISCSNFAKISINKLGIAGLVIFMDRYLYRENREAFNNYVLIIDNSGKITLDDDDFLP